LTDKYYTIRKTSFRTMRKYRTLFNFLLILLFSIVNSLSYGQAKKRVVLDADTGNEVDDLYAISRALIEPSWDVTALNATQWQVSHRAVPESMENSFRINEAIVGYLGVNVPLKRGGVNRMYDWGDLAQHSAAAYEIIKQARITPAGQRLTVVALGALTNVASALYIEPAIAAQMEVYWLGSGYDFDKGILTLTEFNCVMDVQALQIMLHSSVPMHILPVTTARQMVFGYAETEARLRGIHPLGNLLVDRWYNQMGGGRLSRVIWDLALIEAMIHPEWAEQAEVMTSKDNGNRSIWFYKSIKADRMKQDFFNTLIPYLKAKK
jgi:purine nucleosidase